MPREYSIEETTQWVGQYLDGYCRYMKEHYPFYKNKSGYYKKEEIDKMLAGEEVRFTNLAQKMKQ